MGFSPHPLLEAFLTAHTRGVCPARSPRSLAPQATPPRSPSFPRCRGHCVCFSPPPTWSVLPRPCRLLAPWGRDGGPRAGWGTRAHRHAGGTWESSLQRSRLPTPALADESPAPGASVRLPPSRVLPGTRSPPAGGSRPAVVRPRLGAPYQTTRDSRHEWSPLPRSAVELGGGAVGARAGASVLPVHFRWWGQDAPLGLGLCDLVYGACAGGAAGTRRDAGPAPWTPRPGGDLTWTRDIVTGTGPCGRREAPGGVGPAAPHPCFPPSPSRPRFSASTQTCPGQTRSRLFFLWAAQRPCWGLCGCLLETTGGPSPPMCPGGLWSA